MLGASVLSVMFVLMLFLASPAWAQTPPPPPTTLSVTKTDAPVDGATVEVGEDITYSIDVKNTGDAPARQVTLTDDLPAGTAFRSINEPPGATCTTPDQGETGTVECDLGGIPKGGTETVTITVTAVKGGIVENTATADGSNTDPDTDGARTRVGPNLTIDKIDDRDPVSVGGNILYTLRVTNEGSTDVGSPTNPIVVIDELPIGDVRLVSVDSNDFNCDRLDPPTGRIRCTNRAPLGPDDVASIKITVDPDRPETVTNTAEIRFNRFLIDSDTETTQVKSAAADGGGGGGNDDGDGDNNGGDNTGDADNPNDVVDGTTPGKTLSDTGGVSVVALMAGAILAGSGLLLRSALRRGR